VRRPDRTREVREKEQRALERCDEHRVEPRVVGRNLRAELGDAALDLLGREVRLADPEVVAQRPRSSLNLCARRSMSRR
jgi:hypothetical protein